MESLKNIFIVEDEHELRSMLARYVEGQGHQVTSFPDTSQVLSEVLKQAPEVIITDLNMPGGTGVELIKKVRTYFKDLPIILMTGEALDKVEQEIRGIDFVKLLSKPFQLKAMLNLIEA